MQYIKDNHNKLVVLFVILIVFSLYSWSDNKKIREELKSTNLKLTKALTEQRVEYEHIEIEVDKDCDAYIEDNMDNICEDCKQDFDNQPSKTYDSRGSSYE